MSEPLPSFRLSRPQTIDDAIAARAAVSDSRFLAGGTDLVPNLRRGLIESEQLIDLSQIVELKEIKSGKKGLIIGAGVTLATLCGHKELRKAFPAIAEAADTVAAPGHRAAATIGGNLCLDTRCIYYNQSHWWRKSNDFCLKFKGDTCHVAPAGNRCRAAFSGDLAPAFMVHDASVEIAGSDGRRTIPLAELYREDGADHLTLASDEMLVAVHLPKTAIPMYSGYEKIRLRGSIDFPLAGIAASCQKTGDATRFVFAMTGTNSAPVPLGELEAVAADTDFESWLNTLGKLVQKQVSPQRTTTAAAHYRRMAAAARAQSLARRLMEAVAK